MAAGCKAFGARTLSLTRADPQKGAAYEPIKFDSRVMADGTSPIDNPVLRLGLSANPLSFGKRRSGPSRSVPSSDPGIPALQRDLAVSRAR